MSCITAQPGIDQWLEATSLFGTVSNVYLGQMIGVDALAAVSAFFPVMFFLFAFVMGLSTGATVLIGQAFGAGEHGGIRSVAGTTPAVGLLRLHFDCIDRRLFAVN